MNIRDILIEFTESIKDYEHEAGQSIEEQGRSSSEIVDIFLGEQE